MGFSIRFSGSTMSVGIFGVVNHEASDRFRKELLECVAIAPPRVIIDLSRVMLLSRINAYYLVVACRMLSSLVAEVKVRGGRGQVAAQLRSLSETLSRDPAFRDALAILTTGPYDPGPIRAANHP